MTGFWNWGLQGVFCRNDTWMMAVTDTTGQIWSFRAESLNDSGPTEKVYIIVFGIFFASSTNYPMFSHGSIEGATKIKM